MKREKGFVATSILYSFFLVFITLFIGILANYFHNKNMINIINKSAKIFLDEKNAMQLSEIKLGEYINILPRNNNIIKENATWILSYIEKSEDKSVYYFLSDKDIIKKDFNLDELNNIFVFQNIKINLPTISFLEKIRSLKIENKILNNIYNVKDNYMIYADKTSGNYIKSNFYDYNYYVFNDYNQASAENKCGLDNSIYNYNNTFGYVSKYDNKIEFCYYSNDTPKDIEGNISKNNIRLVAIITINKQINSFIKKGNGTKYEPYILTDGVKVS